MKAKKRPYSTLVPVALAAIVGVLLYLVYQNGKKAPPVYQPADLNPEYVDPGLQGVTSGHRVGDFSLINQFGDTITEKYYQGKVFVTDFFFTRCPSICPVMTANMAKLQDRFRKESELKLLSISVTPEYDSVPVLEEYALKNNAIPNKWNICTGEKTHIYELARKQFFAVSDQSDGLMQDFVHSPNFVLVDTEKKIRGIYDGTRETELERLTRDIENLLGSRH